MRVRGRRGLKNHAARSTHRGAAVMPLVLILEDDVLLRAGMARSLGRLPGVEVVEAATVREAIALVEGLDVDLVLSDLQLGDGTALELLPRLVRPRGPIPVVLISGWVAEFAEHLPSGVEVRCKPIEPGALRELVTRMLGCADGRPPFTLADYLQLAGLGRHSVQVTVRAESGPLGTVTVCAGQAWSAEDAHGGGLEALVRLLAATDAMIDCGAVIHAPPPSLAGSCEGVLMEAMRLLDERRAGHAPATPRTSTRPRVATSLAEITLPT